MRSWVVVALLGAGVWGAGCVEGGENPAGRGPDVANVARDGAGAGAGDGAADGGGADGGSDAGVGVDGAGADGAGVGDAGQADGDAGAGEDGGDQGPTEGDGEADGGDGDVGEDGEDGAVADVGDDDGGGEGGGGEGEGEGGAASGSDEGQGGDDGGAGPGSDGGAEGGEVCEPIGDRELCGTGIDEDCDGEIDEGFEIDDPCEAGRGACHRVGEWVCTVDGRGLFCDVTPGVPGTELCGTGVDEDCDGEIDERFVVGQECQVGVGDCRALGEWECSADGRGVICSAQRGDGRLELCGDGRDNDCDGEVDEAAWVGGDCQVGVGVCVRAGAWECGEDGRSECSVQPGAPEEPEGEVSCDGRDNDCDGVTDEFPAGGGPCEVGRGVCHRRGELICRADGGEICSVRAGDAQEPDGEVTCDSLDNDCDGEVDEGMGLGQPCQGGVGACRVQGVTACDGQGRVGCSVRPPEAPEPGIERTCDDVDNDCDGEVDEGCDDDGDGRCDAGMAMGAGSQRCPDTPAGGVGGVGDDCDDDDDGRRPGLVDGCDGVDQDCDGEVDEAGAEGGGRCVPPFAGALAKSQGRWGYGGEVGLEGARSSCRVLAAHSDLCSRDDLVSASESGELAGAVGEDGQAVTSFWVDTADAGRCERGGAPWAENDPEADARGHVIFIRNETGEVVSERDTICSVPRHVACCGWAAP